MAQQDKDNLQGRRVGGFSAADKPASSKKPIIKPGTPARGFTPQNTAADSGLVRGPGTGTSDDVPDQVPQGTYILPADTTQKMGMGEAAERESPQFERSEEAGEKLGMGDDGDGVPVNLSNGEFKLSPEQIYAIGVGVLNQVKSATHAPAPRGFSPGNQQPDPNATGAGGFGFSPKDQRPAPAPSSFANDGAVGLGFVPKAQRPAPESRGTGGFGFEPQGFADGGVVRDETKKIITAPSTTPATPTGFSEGQMKDLYNKWQSEKTPWYMPTPKANVEERTAEATYTNAVRNRFNSQPETTPQDAYVGVSATDAQGQVTRNLQQRLDTKGRDSQPEATPQDAYVGVSATDARGQVTRNLQQRLDSTGREGMTNADVGQANPQGVVTMKQGTNGVPEFSGSNIKGPVSYADGQGQAIAGAGIRGQGFGNMTALPAGATGTASPLPNTALGFSSDRGQGASTVDSLIRAGASGAQALQYNNEVQRAQATNAMQQQMIGARRPEGTVMNGLMERTPDQQRRDAEVSASSIHARTAALGKNQLAAVNADAESRTRANTAKYTADASAGANMHQANSQLAGVAMRETGDTQREAGRNAIQQGELGLKREAQGFTSRAAAQQEQLRNTLIDPNATPEQRRIAQRNLAAFSGKTAADRMQVVNLPDTTTDMGAVVRGGQALVRTLEDGTVEQVPIAGRGAATQPMPADKAQRKTGTTYALPDGRRVLWDGKGAILVNQ